MLAGDVLESQVNRLLRGIGLVEEGHCAELWYALASGGDPWREAEPTWRVGASRTTGGRIGLPKLLLARLAGLPSQVRVRQGAKQNPATRPRRCKTLPAPGRGWLRAMQPSARSTSGAAPSAETTIRLRKSGSKTPSSTCRIDGRRCGRSRSPLRSRRRKKHHRVSTSYSCRPKRRPRLAHTSTPPTTHRRSPC